MGSIAKVEIPEGSGNYYYYEYEPGVGKTVYKGPVGSAPAITEEEFNLVVVATERNVMDTRWWPDGADLPRVEQEAKARETEKRLAAIVNDERLLRGLKPNKFRVAEYSGLMDLRQDPDKSQEGDFWFSWWNYANEGLIPSNARQRSIVHWMSELDRKQPGRNIHIESLDWELGRDTLPTAEQIATARRVYNKVEDVWKDLGKRKVIVDVWDDQGLEPGIIGQTSTEKFWLDLGFTRKYTDITGGEGIHMLEKDIG
jgi:hypothetical protein